MGSGVGVTSGFQGSCSPHVSNGDYEDLRQELSPWPQQPRTPGGRGRAGQMAAPAVTVIADFRSGVWCQSLLCPLTGHFGLAPPGLCLPNVYGPRALQSWEPER